jgi:predicted kinase
MLGDPALLELFPEGIFHFDDVLSVFSQPSYELPNGRTLGQLLRDLDEVPQDPEWHGEGSVWQHLRLVVPQARKLGQQLPPLPRAALMLAALLHDVGKAQCTKLATVNGRERIVSPRHAEAGRNLLVCALSAALPPLLWQQVVELVGTHHHPRQLVEDSRSADAFYGLVARVDPRLLFLLEEADLRGRFARDQDSELDTLRLFQLECESLGLWPQEDWAACDADLASRDPYREWRARISEAFPKAELAQRVFYRSCRDFETGNIHSVEEGIARGYALADAPHLALTCGPSGSGKSRWAKEQAAHFDEIISLDALREELTGDEREQGENARVVALARERLREALRKRRNVIWDATSLRRDFRRIVVQLGWDYGAFVSISAFAAPLPVLRTTLAQRQRAIPESVLLRQLASLQWPERHEADAVFWYGAAG